MYEELVKRLRERAINLKEKFSRNAELLSELMQAADAIEELLPFKEQVEKGMGLLDKADELLNAVKPSWIPVTERVPEKYGTYLVTTKRGSVMVGCYYPKAQNWNIRATAAYWMPLPEPPKEES